MADYTITFARSASKELEGLSAPIVGRIFRRIEDLAKDPRPASCRKLEGSENLWRVRVGDYRVVYQVFDDEHIVDIVAIRHRSQVYKPR